MIIPFVLFLILIIWGAFDGEVYWKEGIVYGLLFLISLLGWLLVPGYGLYFVVPVVLVDIVLLVKMVGNPTMG